MSISDNRESQPTDPETSAVDPADTGDTVGTGDIVDPELEALMERLRFIADDIDAPPAISAELARAAFETRSLDAQLAVLTVDSEIDTPELVRSTAVEPRMVAFETGSVTIELQLDRHDATVTVRGLVAGATGAMVIESGGRRISTELDERGWFLVEGVPAGALRLRFTGDDGGTVATAWFAA